MHPELPVRKELSSPFCCMSAQSSILATYPKKGVFVASVYNSGERPTGASSPVHSAALLLRPSPRKDLSVASLTTRISRNALPAISVFPSRSFTLGDIGCAFPFERTLHPLKALLSCVTEHILLPLAAPPKLEFGQQQGVWPCMVPVPGPPFSSCRILLEGEPPEDDAGLPAGIVGRLYFTEHSQPAVKQPFSPFETRKLSLLALGLQHVANQRGPDALVGAIPGDSPHSMRMRELAEACYTDKECLVASQDWGDVVLVPRSPAVSQEDNFNFLVFVTNLRAADVCDIVRHSRKTVLVLDLDNTLVDAVPVAITQKDWDALYWQPCSVTTENGREVAAQYAAVMDHDPLAEAVYIMHWRLGRLACTFKVRVRRGWERLREYLVAEKSRYEVFVCSKGKQEYVQLLWHFLDPLSQLFPPTDWDWRLNSTYPDAVPRALPKTLLSALGCVYPLDDAPPAQLACPVLCLDDSREAYQEQYNCNVLFCEEYRPSDLYQSDTGSVLRQAGERLAEFWEASYGDEVDGPWVQVVDAVVELMHDMLGQALDYPEGLLRQQEAFDQLGAWLRKRVCVLDVFGERAYIGDIPASPTSAGEATTAAAAAGEEGAVEALLSAVAAEPAGEAAAAAEEGKESSRAMAVAGAAAGAQGRSPEDSALLDVSNLAPLAIGPAAAGAPAASEPVSTTVRGGRRQYVTAESLLCKLCAPAGACLPGCPACAELAAVARGAAKGGGTARGEDGGGKGREEDGEEYEVPVSLDGSPSTDDDFMGGWYDSACSTPRSVAREGPGGDGSTAGLDEEETEAQAEAAHASAFASVDPSLQEMGQSVFHMRMARLGGNSHTMLLVPSARTFSGLGLDTGGVLSSSPGRHGVGVGTGRSPPKRGGLSPRHSGSLPKHWPCK